MNKIKPIVLLIILPAILFGQVSYYSYDKLSFLKNEHAELLSKPMYNSHMDNYDVTFYRLDLSAGNTSAYIEGNVTINATVQKSDLDTFVVELYYEYMVDSVLINNTKCNHLIYDNEIKVGITPSLVTGTAFSAQIFYHGENPPELQEYAVGITHNSGYAVTYTLSEPFFSKYWFPCKQVLEDKADSVYVFITTDSTLKAGSNGRLTAVVPVGGGKVRYEWKSRHPITYYLISVCIADYVEYNIYAKPDGPEDSILIQNYVYDSAYLEAHKEDIDITRDIIELYSSLYGPYPFKDEKYGHCLAPMGGGMEHQTMTTLSSLDFTLVAHELAHQWFGDYVTCGTWQDIWINEGFATYSEILSQEHIYGEFPSAYYNSYFNYALLNCQDGSVYIPDDDFAIDYSDGSQLIGLVMRIFDRPLSYVKGAMLLHMIRFELQDDGLFYLSLREYLEEHRDSFATGLDFKSTLESTSGKDFTDFFNQWYFGEGYPVYNITWKQEQDTLVINSVQTTTSEATPLFKTPVEYRIYSAGSDTVLRLLQEQNNQVFKIIIPKTVDSIEVNKGNDILARIESVNFSTVINKRNYGSSELSISRIAFDDYLELEFACTKSEKIIILSDITGRVISQNTTGDKSVNIYTGNLTSGIYIIEVISGNERIVKKMIKR